MKLSSFLFLVVVFVTVMMALTFAQDTVKFYAYAPAGTALTEAELSKYVVLPLLDADDVEICYPHSDEDVVAFCQITSPGTPDSSEPDAEESEVDDVVTYELCEDYIADETIDTPAVPCFEIGTAEEIIHVTCTSVKGKIIDAVPCPTLPEPTIDEDGENVPVSDEDKAEADIAILAFCDVTTMKAYDDIVVHYTIKIDATDQQDIVLPEDVEGWVVDDTQPFCPAITCFDTDGETKAVCDDIIPTLVCNDDKEYSTPLHVVCTTPSGLEYQSTDKPSVTNTETDYTTICGQYIPEEYTECIPRYYICSFTDDATKATIALCDDNYTVDINVVPCTEAVVDDNDDTTPPVDEDDEETVTPQHTSEDDNDEETPVATKDGVYHRYTYCYYNNAVDTTGDKCSKLTAPAPLQCSLDERVFIAFPELVLEDTPISLTTPFEVVFESIYFDVLDSVVIELRPVVVEEEEETQETTPVPGPFQVLHHDTTTAHLYRVDVTSAVQAAVKNSKTEVTIKFQQTLPSDEDDDEETPEPTDPEDGEEEEGNDGAFVLTADGDDDDDNTVNLTVVVDATDGTAIVKALIDSGKYTAVIIVTPHPKAHGEDHDGDDEDTPVPAGSFTVQHHETIESIEYIVQLDDADAVIDIPNLCDDEKCNGFGCAVSHVCQCPEGSTKSDCSDVVCTAEQVDTCGEHGTCFLVVDDESTTNEKVPACQCADGWSGDKCDTPVCTTAQATACGKNTVCTIPSKPEDNDDDNNNDGETTPTVVEPVCTCIDGFERPDEETTGDCSVHVCTKEEIDVCNASLHAKKDECTIKTDQDDNGKDIYFPVCTCIDDYTGDACEIAPIDICKEPANTGLCAAGSFAQCTPVDNEATCTCVDGPLTCDNGIGYGPYSDSATAPSDAPTCGCTCSTSTIVSWVLQHHTGPTCGCEVIYTTLNVGHIIKLSDSTRATVTAWHTGLRQSLADAINLDVELITLLPSIEQLVDTSPTSHPYGAPTLTAYTSKASEAYLTFGIIACGEEVTEEETTPTEEETETPGVPEDPEDPEETTPAPYTTLQATPKKSVSSDEARGIITNLSSPSAQYASFFESDEYNAVGSSSYASQFAAAYTPTCTESASVSCTTFSPKATYDADNGQEENSQNQNDDEDGMSTTTIVIICVILGAVVIALIILIACCCIQKRNKNNNFPSQNNAEMTDLV